MAKKVLLFVNPHSGKAKAKKYLMDIIRKFSKAGFSVSVLPTDGDRNVNAKRLAKEAKSAKLCVALGGDGTFTELICDSAAGFVNSPIAPIPLGSANDLADSLGFSSDPLTAANQIISNFDESPVLFDVGSFNDTNFGYVAAAGAFTEVSYETPGNMKNILGRQAYFWEGFKSLQSIKPVPMKIEIPGKTFAGDFIFCSVSNSLVLGGVLKFNPDRVSFDDGLFELTLIRAPKTPAEFSLVADGIIRAHNSDLFRSYKVSKVSISSPFPLKWTLDGENGGVHREVLIKSLPGAVKIVKSTLNPLDSIK